MSRRRAVPPAPVQKIPNRSVQTMESNPSSDDEDVPMMDATSDQSTASPMADSIESDYTSGESDRDEDEEPSEALEFASPRKRLYTGSFEANEKAVEAHVAAINASVNQGRSAAATRRQGFEMRAAMMLRDQLHDENSELWAFILDRVDKMEHISNVMVAPVIKNGIRIEKQELVMHAAGGRELRNMLNKIQFADTAEIDRLSSGERLHNIEQGVDAYAFVNRQNIVWKMGERSAEPGHVVATVLMQAKCRDNPETARRPDLTTFLQAIRRVERNQGKLREQSEFTMHVVVGFFVSNRRPSSTGVYESEEAGLRADGVLCAHMDADSDEPRVRTHLYDHQIPVVKTMLKTLDARAIDSTERANAATRCGNSGFNTEDQPPRMVALHAATGAGKTAMFAKLANGEAKTAVCEKFPNELTSDSDVGEPSQLTLILVHEASKGVETIKELASHSLEVTGINLTCMRTDCQGSVGADDYTLSKNTLNEFQKAVRDNKPVIVTNTYASYTASATLHFMRQWLRAEAKAKKPIPRITIVIDEYDLTLTEAHLMLWINIGHLISLGAVVVLASATGKNMYVRTVEAWAHRTRQITHGILDKIDFARAMVPKEFPPPKNGKGTYRLLNEDDLRGFFYADSQFRNATKRGNLSLFTWSDGIQARTMASSLELMLAQQTDRHGARIDYENVVERARAAVGIVRMYNLKRGYFVVPSDTKSGSERNSRVLQKQLVYQFGLCGLKAWVLIVDSHANHDVEKAVDMWLNNETAAEPHASPDDAYDVYIVIVKQMLIRGRDTKRAQFIIDGTSMNTPDTGQMDGRIIRCVERFFKKMAYVVVLSRDRLKTHLDALGGDISHAEQNLAAVRMSELPTDQKGLEASRRRARKQNRAEKNERRAWKKVERSEQNDDASASDDAKKAQAAQAQTLAAKNAVSEALDPCGRLGNQKDKFVEELTSFVRASVRPDGVEGGDGVTTTSVPATDLGDKLANAVTELLRSGNGTTIGIQLYDLRGVRDDVIECCFYVDGKRKLYYNASDYDRRRLNETPEAKTSQLAKAVANYDEAVARGEELVKCKRGEWGSALYEARCLEDVTSGIKVESHEYSGRDVSFRLLRGRGYSPEAILSLSDKYDCCTEPETATSDAAFEALCCTWQWFDDAVSKLDDIPPRREREMVAHLLANNPNSPPQQGDQCPVTPYGRLKHDENSVYDWVRRRLGKSYWDALHPKSRERLSALEWVRKRREDASKNTRIQRVRVRLFRLDWPMERDWLECENLQKAMETTGCSTDQLNQALKNPNNTCGGTDGYRWTVEYSMIRRFRARRCDGEQQEWEEFKSAAEFEKKHAFSPQYVAQKVQKGHKRVRNPAGHEWDAEWVEHEQPPSDLAALLEAVGARTKRGRKKK